MVSQGYLPHRVAVSGNPARICVVYTRGTAPLRKKFVAVDARDPSPPYRVDIQVFGGIQDIDDPIIDTKPKWVFDSISSKRTMSGFAGRELQALGGLSAFGPTRSPRRKRRSSSNRLAGGGLVTLGGALSETIYPIGGTSDDPPMADDASEPNLAFNRYWLIDNWVRTRLENSGVRAAQVAIARGGRLVVNRAYTLAEKGYPVAHPDHLFRIGSIAKAFTGMAAAHHFFPNGEVSGLELSLAEALGLQDCQNAALQQKLYETPLYWLLKHQAGWPTDFDYPQVAQVARGKPLPNVPGDTLDYIRGTSVDFYAAQLPDGTYMSAYSGATLRALGERVSQLFPPIGDDANYEARMRDWWDLSPEKARAWQSSPQACLDAHMFPNHSLWIGFSAVPQLNGPPVLRPAQFNENYDYALAAGTWAMSAATTARIASGMDASSSVKALLTPVCVQAMLNGNMTGYGQALFAGKPEGMVPVTRFIHNGAAAGTAAVVAIDFPGSSALPSPVDPTTCIAYVENFDAPGGLADAQIDQLKALALEIEQLYGWEGDDLFSTS